MAFLGFKLWIVALVLLSAADLHLGQTPGDPPIEPGEVKFVTREDGSPREGDDPLEPGQGTFTRQSPRQSDPLEPGQGTFAREDPRFQDPRLRDPRLQNPRPADPIEPGQGTFSRPDPRLSDPRLRDPRLQNPRPADPIEPGQGTFAREDPRFQDPRLRDPRLQNPRPADPIEPGQGIFSRPDPRLSDPRLRDPRLQNPRPANPLEPGQGTLARQDPRYIDPRYQDPLWNNTYHNKYHHLRDHDPKVTARYNQPYDPRRPIWRCDLRVNSCFLKNRVKYAPFRLQSNFAAATQALVLDVGLAARSLHGLTNRPKPIYAHNAARLRSHGYFPADYVDACLTFSYYWNGVGRKSLKMLQRNEETTCIYSDDFGSSDLRLQHDGQWKNVTLQLNLRYGPPRFVIEFTFDTGAVRELGDYSQLGYIAIKDFSIGYGVCARNDANECDAAQSVNRPLTTQVLFEEEREQQPQPGWPYTRRT